MNYLNKYLKYKHKYLQLKGGSLVVPQYIMNDKDIIYLVNKYPCEIKEKFIYQYKHILTDNSNEQIKNYKNMIIDMYKKLMEEIKLYQSENICTPITIVTVGNTPYKITRLIELFCNIKNINFIYLPYSGSFYKIKKECTCGTVALFIKELNKKDIEGKYPNDRDENKCKTQDFIFENKVYSLCHWNHCDLLRDIPKANIEYMKTYLSNREQILNQQYNLEEQQSFENMIINSGLKNSIDKNHKIIFIDYLETGIGFLSFLMTIDKYLNKDNTFVIGLTDNIYQFTSLYTDKNASTLINTELILNKYNIKYIELNVYLDANYDFLLIDQETEDRCVKSYKKINWDTNYTNYSEQYINNCNVALLNMALILKNNKLII
jgi:hypothetical protein